MNGLIIGYELSIPKSKVLNPFHLLKEDVSGFMEQGGEVGALEQGDEIGAVLRLERAKEVRFLIKNPWVVCVKGATIVNGLYLFGIKCNI